MAERLARQVGATVPLKHTNRRELVRLVANMGVNRGVLQDLQTCTHHDPSVGTSRLHG